MTLQESLDKLKVKLEGNMPGEFVNIMHKATTDLEATGIGEGVLKKGDKAPTFNLPNQDGSQVDSAELLAKGPLVITFYRGIWCPYCNLDLGNLKRYTEELNGLGAQMVSISPQLTQYNKQIVNQQRLKFDLLSDSGNQVADAFGLRWEMIDPLKGLYKDKFNISLPHFNGDESWTLPIPARFIIGVDGTIKYAEYSVDYTKRPNPDVLVAALEQ
ncbi:peroxiredoxin-like family protein [Cytophaga sp. FL35]|uniref:peroxiredoxin-like family protein n=1 Tax=Cytophaga sp. FL35 TaxID=1904456 RepID=UPI0016538DEF|nr:peroxiredoxin-like family protein [Cytophaga sp. FL35]MBC6997022.1 AhpC/TSA family protein [Cytophaga sp. FL35]